MGKSLLIKNLEKERLLLMLSLTEHDLREKELLYVFRFNNN